MGANGIVESGLRLHQLAGSLVKSVLESNAIAADEHLLANLEAISTAKSLGKLGTKLVQTQIELDRAVLDIVA